MKESISLNRMNKRRRIKRRRRDREREKRIIKVKTTKENDVRDTVD